VSDFGRLRSYDRLKLRIEGKDYTGQQDLPFFFFGTRGKISNPNRNSNAEFKYVSSFSPSPTIFFVTAKLSVKEMCIFTYYIHYSPYLKCEGC